MVVALALPRSGAAQMIGGERPERPNRALFGGGVGQTGHLLLVGASLSGGNDRFLSLSSDADGAPGRNDGARFGSGAVTLRYGLNRSRFTLDVEGVSSARYAPAFFRGASESHQGSLTTGLQVSTRTRVGGSVAARRQPLSATALFPGMFDGIGAPPVPTDYEIRGLGRYTVGSGALTMSHALSRRSTVLLGYDYGYSGGAGETRAEHVYYGYSARYRHELSRSLALRLGYGRGSGEYRLASPEARRLRNHLIDAGVDFNRALSFSRRTSLSLSTGTALVSDGDAMRADAVGSASLNHEIGRSWLAAIGYQRRMGFVAEIPELVSTDSAFATFGGLIGRRLGVQARTGVSVGEVGPAASLSNRFRSYHATAGVQTGLTRNLAVSLGYIYYRYRFDSSAFLPGAINTRGSRQSVQASLVLSAPLIHRARSSNAAR